jgi:hypothetical protein
MTNPRSPGGNAPRRRATIELSRDLERGLRSYAVAAKGITRNWDKAIAASAVGVAGFAMLASLPAEAEVVYTRADIHVFRSRTGESFASIDINNDGQADFQLVAFWGANFSSGADSVYSVMRFYGNTPSNQAMSTSQGLKAALPPGAQVGPAGKFGTHPFMASCDVFDGKPFISGNWVNVKNRYLGVKFQISGETHYGWIRMTEHCNNGTITGYAYQTEANQPITIGPTDMPVDGNLQFPLPNSATAKPASLGALAMGAPGLASWRRE